MKQKRDRLNDESRLSRFTTHVVLIFASFLAFGPFVWMFLTSIKTYEETIQIPMKFLPEIPQWVNYSIVSDKLNFTQPAVSEHHSGDDHDDRGPDPDRHDLRLCL